MREMKNSQFLVRLDEDDRILFLGHAKGAESMNWVEGKEKWGTVRCPKGLKAYVNTRFTEEGTLIGTFTLENTTAFPMGFKRTDVGIYAVFNDNYEDTDVCLSGKCHAHIFNGEEAFWAMALQMGGQGPHLGMKLLKGSILSYSVERDLKEESNDRGDFLLHPDLPILEAGEKTELVFELFWFEDREDFFEKLLETPGFPVIRARQFTLFEGERLELDIEVSGEYDREKIRILKGEEDLPFELSCENGKSLIHCEALAKEPGECRLNILVGGKKTHADFFVAEKLKNLIGKRCRFLIEKQQYHRKGSPLDGAFLIYDNQEEKQYYSHLDDHNGGRERISMGILLARYLQKREEPSFLKGLKEYVSYVYRELYDEETGIVYNDICRNLDWHRLYNYPWMSLFQLELYRLFQDTKYLKDSFRTMHRYYEEGGTKFYGIAIPAVELYEALRAERLCGEADCFLEEFLAHARQILKNGLHYPPFEVRYEQSIVAPAVSCLFQAYSLSQEKAFLKEGERQLKVLELFNGFQPDYHQYEVAIRHWDGRWFGKYRNYGDTYPHYWSALTGIAYEEYGRLTSSGHYLEKAGASFRGVLNLFTRDGRGSCAMVYPETVNGALGHYYDPWANDQDWALYFALRYEAVTTGGK